MMVVHPIHRRTAKSIVGGLLGSGTGMPLPNALPMNSSNRTFWTLFWVLVCLHQLYFGWFMVRSDFVPYVMDGNETFSVWWHAHNLYTFSFWKSFGLTDESYGLTEASHPFFHTHQGNMPRLFGFLIYALGARTVEAQVLVTTLIIGNLTLFFCYASIAKLTRPAIAFMFCLFLFSDYLLYAQWHVVTYRVWYGFIFFGTLFAISHAAPENRIWPYALLGLLFFLLFYFELVFAGYVSIAAGLWALWLHWGSPKRIAALYAVQLIAGVAALTLLFSQLVLVFGIDVVKADFSTTFLARNASTAGITYGSVEAYFHGHNIVFWNNFRDGGSLRTLVMFVRSIGNYIFQVWTPVFFILIGVPFAGVLISFLQRSPDQRNAVENPAAHDSKSCSFAYPFEARVVDPHGPGRSLSFHIPRALTRGGIWPLLACAVVALLALLAVMLPGALFGLEPDRAPEIIGAIVLRIVIAGSLALLVFAGWRDRPLWMSTCPGILTTALGALLIIKSHVLFDQAYSDIWMPLYQDWKVRLILRSVTVIAFVVAVGIAALGASASFGLERESSIRRALVFLGIGFITYTSIYVLSPGYVLSGYAERHAPFAIFFVAMVPAVAIYAMIAAGRRYGKWLFTYGSFERRGGRIVVPLLVAVAVAVPALLWIRVQVYYARLFPPDHLAFLQRLKSPPLHGATFAVSNYAAPVAYYAGNWAYFDAVVASDVGLSDPSTRWFADWKSNDRYAYPDYYLCMRTKTFASALLERFPAREDLPFRFCKDERILRKQESSSSEPVVSDFAEPKFWSAAAFYAGRPKIDAVSISVSFLDDQWRIVPAVEIEPNLAHPPISTEFELRALSEATSCDVKKSDLKVIQENRDSSNLALPHGFKGSFLVRARARADIGVGKWKSGDLWTVKATPADPAGTPTRCPSPTVWSSFDLGDLTMRQKGWGDAESWGIWTIASEATLRPFLISDIAENSDILLEATARGFIPKPGGVQQVTVRANGIVVANWTLTDTKPVSARIPKSVMAGRPDLVLSFGISNPTSPASGGLSSDVRELGMGLIALKLKKLDQ
jgi:hypothetical protein